MPAVLRSCAGTIGVSISSSGRYLSACLLTPPPTTKRSGEMQPLQGAVVDGEPLGPLLPGQVVLLPDAVRRRGLGVLAVDLDVPQLGVRHQHAVVHERGADAGAQGGEHHQAGAAGRSAVPRLREPGRVGVVDHDHVASQPLLEHRGGVGVDPRLVDVGRRLHDPAHHHAGDGDADRGPVTRTLVDEVGDHVGDVDRACRRWGSAFGVAAGERQFGLEPQLLGFPRPTLRRQHPDRVDATTKSPARIRSPRREPQ